MPEVPNSFESGDRPKADPDTPDTQAKKAAVRLKYPDNALPPPESVSPPSGRQTFERLVGPDMQNLVRELQGKGFTITKQLAPNYDGATYLYARGPDGKVRWFIADTASDKNGQPAGGGELRVRGPGPFVGSYRSLDAMMRDIGTWGGAEKKADSPVPRFESVSAAPSGRQTFERLVGPDMQNLVRELQGKGFTITKQLAPNYDGATYLYARGPDGKVRWFIADTASDQNGQPTPGGELRVRGPGPFVGSYRSLDAMMRDSARWAK